MPVAATSSRIDSPDLVNRRLAGGLLLSVLLHALVLSLQFGMPGLTPGRPVPITVTLAPAPLALPPAPEPVPAKQPPPAPASQPAASGMRLLNPVETVAPPPAVAPPRKRKRPPARRTRPPAPAARPESMRSPVIAQDPNPDATFAVPLPRPEDATEKGAEPMATESGTEQAGPAARSALEAAQVAELEDAKRREELAAQERAAADAEARGRADDEERRRLARQEEANRLQADQLEARQRRVAEERDRVLAQQRITVEEQERTLAQQREAAEAQSREQQRTAAEEQARMLAKQHIESQRREEQRRQAALEEAARRQAEDEARRQAWLRQHDLEELAAKQQAEQLALKRQAEEVSARRQAEALAARQQAEQLAQQQLADQLAERRNAEELARQQAGQASRERTEQAARRRAEQAAAGQQRERIAAEGRDPHPGPAGTGATDGLGGAGARAGVPKNLLGSDIASRARELSRGIDILGAVPPAARPAAEELARRRAVVGAGERDVPLRMYVDSFRQKIERNGILHQGQLSSERVRIDPLVSVALRSDGSVEEVTIVRSSGRAETDEAVRRIVRVNARYSAFPPNVAARFDVIEIRRIWTFAEGLKLLEEMR